MYSFSTSFAILNAIHKISVCFQMILIESKIITENILCIRHLESVDTAQENDFFSFFFPFSAHD